MKIKFKKRFAKQIDKLSVKIQNAFYARMSIFQDNQFSPILNNHQLTGKYKGFRSINITGDWRAIFKEFADDDLIIFYLIGTHGELYK